MSRMMLFIIALAFAPPVAAQQIPSEAAEAAEDDIIVEGYLDRRKQSDRIDVPAAISGVQNRRKYEVAERVAECAARSRLAPLGRLRAVVDGEFGTITHAVALDRLRRIYITCGEGIDMLSITTPDAPSMALSQNEGGAIEAGIIGAPVQTDPAPLGYSIYHRGALTIAAIKQFAPKLRLTQDQTNDPAVQRRYDLREIPRNRHRLPVDTQYFQVATCMVRLEPRLAVRLTVSEGAAELSGLEAAIINRARVCVGGAKQVKVDATQFRLYIADAVYRWAVAANGVDSLIPEAS